METLTTRHSILMDLKMLQRLFTANVSIEEQSVVTIHFMQFINGQIAVAPLKRIHVWNFVQPHSLSHLTNKLIETLGINFAKHFLCIGHTQKFQIC